MAMCRMGCGDPHGRCVFLRHLSAGDLLREERNREGSEYGDLIEK